MKRWDLVGVVDVLPQSIISQLETPKIISKEQVPSNIVAKILTLPFTNRYIIRDNTVSSYFIFERYSEDIFVMYNVSVATLDHIQYSAMNGISFDKIKSDAVNYYDIDVKGLFKYWKEDPDYSASLHDDSSLNMVPPDQPSKKPKERKNNIDGQLQPAHENPKEYLERKYYESLYSLKNPLAYFVKSNLVRFKNMCRSKYEDEFMMNFQTILLDLLLVIPKFDQRYSHTAILTDEDVLNGKYDKYGRNKLIEEYCLVLQNGNAKMKGMANDITLILKAREIKLQVILLLEIIHNNNLDKNFEDFEKKYNPNLKKRSVNLTKRSKIKRHNHTQKKVEARLGESALEEFSAMSIDFCEQVDVYLDKLSILEILLETHLSSLIRTDEEESNTTKIYEYQKNMLNKRQESSSLGFISYVLIPYFNRVIPYTIKFIIKKLKGPSLRVKRSSEQKSIIPSPSVAIDELSMNDMRSHASISRKSSIVSSIVHTGNTISRPSLNRESTMGSMLSMDKNNSNLIEFLEAESNISRQASLLSRTQSDLVMNKLQKRQLPISTFEPSIKRNKSNARFSRDKKGDSSLLASLKEGSHSNQTSFQRVGKRKDQSLSKFERQISFYGGSSQNILEKEVDTVKRQNTVEVMSTPIKPSFLARKTTQSMMGIIESPSVVVPGADNKNVIFSPGLRNNRIGSAKKRSTNIEVESTPKNIVFKSHGKSHINLVVESPAVIETPQQKDSEASKPKREKEDDSQNSKNVRRRLFAP
ncbi:DNA replication regulator Sld3p [Monosporozyma servazzii]